MSAKFAGFSRLIRRISARMFTDTAGPPGLPRRTFQVHNMRNAFPCQAITVSGFKIFNAECHSAHTRETPAFGYGAPHLSTGGT